MAEELKEMNITSKNEKGDEIKLHVKRPEAAEFNVAQEKYLQQFRESLDTGAMLRSNLDRALREQGLWDDKRETTFKVLSKDLTGLEIELKGGGIKLSQGKELYFKMAEKRREIRELTSERSLMDVNTAEGQADNARFNSIVSLCSFKMDGKTKLFKDFADYQKQSSEPYAIEAASQIANMMYGLEPDYEQKLPENAFMIEFEFMDDDLNFLNEDGHKVDSEGRLINDKGFFVNEHGKRIDIYDNLLDDEGELIIDSKPFLDEDGKAIVKIEECCQEEVAEECCKEEVVQVEAKPSRVKAKVRQSTDS